MSSGDSGSPADAASLKARGDAAYKAKDYKAAVDAYTAAIELSESPLLYNNRAAANMMLLQYALASKDCDTAISLAGDDTATKAKALFRKTTALKGLGRIDEAIDTINAGLVFDPTSATAKKDRESLINAKAKMEELRSMLPKAPAPGDTPSRDYESKCRKALPIADAIIREIGSNIRDVNLVKAEVLLGLRRTEEALNLTNAMMKVASNGDVELLSIRARCLYNMGDMENCIKHLQSAMRSDPDNVSVRAFYRRMREMEEKREGGNNAFKRAAYQEAIDLWTACIDMDPLNQKLVGKIYCNRATALSKLKRHEAAIKDCDKAISCDSEYIKAFQRRGDSRFALGGKENIEKAIEDYEKVMELNEQAGNSNSEMKQKLRQAQVALKRAGRKDLYAILGVSQDADEAEIRKKYKHAALKYHPDKQSSKSEEEKKAAEANFKAISEAYEILSDKEKRERYDQGVEIADLDDPHAGCGGGGHGGHGGIDPNILFQMFMQQQAGGRGGGGFGGHHGGFGF